MRIDIVLYIRDLTLGPAGNGRQSGVVPGQL